MIEVQGSVLFALKHDVDKLNVAVLPHTHTQSEHRTVG